jgi:L-rhamnose mutarotase
MEKTIFEQMGGTYEQQGDYLIPRLTLPAEEEKPIGIWGQRHLRYLKTHRKITYMNFLTTGKLNSYLADINEQAENMFFGLVKQMAEREGVTELLKADNQREWVTRMNNIRSRATEIVNHDIICI